MVKKLYDISVKTGEYTSQGETKGRYQTVGALLESDDGKPFISLARWFNPAGVPFKDGNENIMLACFEPREKEGKKAKPKTESTDDTPF